MLSKRTPLLLASGSPRRREMIAGLGISHLVQMFPVDETPKQFESPDHYVERVCLSKLATARAEVDSSQLAVGGILVADTTVALGDRILGKPADADEARGMIRSLCGSRHKVLTCYGLLNTVQRLESIRSVATEVTFRDASDEEISSYVETGEGRDKAGAYAIQGIGAFLVEKIKGSYSNVVGLPLCELVVDLKRLRLLEKYP